MSPIRVEPNSRSLFENKNVSKSQWREVLLNKHKCAISFGHLIWFGGDRHPRINMTEIWREQSIWQEMMMMMIMNAKWAQVYILQKYYGRGGGGTENMHFFENVYALYVFWTNYGLFWSNFDLKYSWLLSTNHPFNGNYAKKYGYN